MKTTRDSIYESVRRCVTNAIYASLRADVRPRELHASDAVFRELHVCAQAYARALYGLGQTPEGAAQLIVAAAREASEPAPLHPSIVAALEEWVREAHEDPAS